MTKSEVVIAVILGTVQAPGGAPLKLPEVEKQIVLAPENTTLGSCTVIWIWLDTVVRPPNIFKVIVYVPGDSKTCAATGPVAELRLLTPGLLPAFQVPLDGSPKSHRYSRS